MGNVFTTGAAASFLGVSQARVRKLIQEGRLPASKRGRDHFIEENDLEAYATSGRKKIGRPLQKPLALAQLKQEVAGRPLSQPPSLKIGNGEIYCGDALKVLPTLPSDFYQSIIADPPYFQVLLDEEWDNTWKSPDEYLSWTVEWVRECRRVLRADGLMFIFGQLGKREHVWLHTCSMLAREMQFHDMVIWDRAVGYNERYDSFTPQYEMVLVLRKTAESTPYFDKNAVRLPYDEAKIQTYLRDNRYKDQGAREAHLRKGKYATNILRVPSLKGASKEKVGHPSQKPIALINQLISASTKKKDSILDPFLGSGTTAASAQELGRNWTGIELSSNYVEISKKRVSELLSAHDVYEQVIL